MHPAPAVPTHVIVIASPAGGVTALSEVVSTLPATIAAAVLVVQHRAAVKGSLFEKILQKTTVLPVLPMCGGERIAAGNVYVAPPDRHALLTRSFTLELTDGRRIRHVRSAANPLFASAAQIYGRNAIGVLLTGSGAESTDGVQAIREAGGIVVAQDEATSQYFSLPRQAIESGAVTYVLPRREIGDVLVRLVGLRPMREDRHAGSGAAVAS